MSILFYDADKDIEVPSTLTGFTRINNPDLINDLEIEPEDTATGFGFLVPPLGRNEWDGHIFVSGATGSGKSFLINKMLEHDKRRRKVFLFTDLDHQDESLLPMFRSGRLKVVVPEPEFPWQVSIPNFKMKVHGSIIVFDDCTKADVLELRDMALEKGRHRDTVVICVNHKLRESSLTKKPLNESKYVIAFPSSNRGSVTRFLADWFDMRQKGRKQILKLSKDGRHVIMHMFTPNAIATTQSVVKI